MQTPIPRIFDRHRLFLISPWLSASAIGLLALIIVVFAASNMQREERHLTETLLRKGLDLANFIMAGTRAPAMTGIPVRTQVQSLIQEAATTESIHSIAVIDGAGTILAHSKPARVETKIDRDPAALAALAAGERGRMVSAADNAGAGQVFEVAVVFEPFRMMHQGRGPRGQGRGGMHRAGGESPPEEAAPPCAMPGNPSSPDNAEPPGQAPAPQGEWCWNWSRGQDPFAQGKHLIVIELDTAELKRAMRQAHTQILILSVALLLVGLAGWLSLLTLQGYRVNRETLQRMEAFTELLVSRLPLGVIATDSVGSILTCNLAAAAMVGLEIPEVLEKRPADVLPADLAGPLVASDSGILERQLVMPYPAGGEQHLHLTAMPIIDRAGLANGRVLLLHDLTPIHRLEEGLRRQERFAALGKMAAGVAHEVRNPLSSIKGFALLLGSRFQPGSEEEETAQLLAAEVERLNRSITALLDYARPLPLDRKPTELRPLIENAIRLMQADAQSAGVVLAVDLENGLPLLSLDADRISQVLLNLLLNAIQAMPDGGRLEIAARRAEGAAVAIAIRDTGCGIPEENLSRILDPYFTTKPNGTGLGLAMVSKIVEEHGGTLRFASAVNKGTTVTVRLPLGPVGSL